MKKKIEINTNKFYDVDKLINHTEVRNTIIRSFWEGLKYSNLPYRKRRQIICKQFFISSNLVERIVTRNC
jgi:xanthine dehydrogenase molybdopterin-binding subunit B